MKWLFVSLRFSIMVWIIMVVFAALASMIYFTDSLRRADVHDIANEAVEKTAVEVEAHSRLAGGHASSAQLIETYLSHEVPEAKDRKSARLNSSHVAISYAVFCLKKKKPHINRT